jgi:hypothetical protein
MTIFFSWRDNKSTDGVADIANWKVKKFTYTWKGSPSEKAFWVFEATSSYKPDKNITKDRALIVFNFADMGESVIKLPENRIYSEDPAFAGEAKHPSMVIWKNNETGAYGIGANLRPFLTVGAIRLATIKEMAKALGLSEREVDVTNQKW